MCRVVHMRHVLHTVRVHVACRAMRVVLTHPAVLGTVHDVLSRAVCCRTPGGMLFSRITATDLAELPANPPCNASKSPLAARYCLHDTVRIVILIEDTGNRGTARDSYIGLMGHRIIVSATLSL